MEKIPQLMEFLSPSTQMIAIFVTLTKLENKTT